jgi:hypothetical protein
MRRVALVGALAAVAAVAVVVALVRPSSSKVEARPFPPAAAQLQQLWATAPSSDLRFPRVLSRFHGWLQGDTRLVFDAPMPRGADLALYLARDAHGSVCTETSTGGGSCFDRFDGAPANLGTFDDGVWNVMTGVLRDGTTGVDLLVGGRWRAARVQGRGVYLTAGGDRLDDAIEQVRYHLVDGSTLTCAWERSC